jgi:hypothetical protein
MRKRGRSPKPEGFAVTTHICNQRDLPETVFRQVQCAPPREIDDISEGTDECRSAPARARILPKSHRDAGSTASIRIIVYAIPPRLGGCRIVVTRM